MLRARIPEGQARLEATLRALEEERRARELVAEEERKARELREAEERGLAASMRIQKHARGNEGRQIAAQKKKVKVEGEASVKI